MAKARPLTTTELKRLKRWVEFDRQLMAMVQVGLCGARVGEIANLTIGQVLQEELGSLPSREDYTIREIIRAVLGDAAPSFHVKVEFASITRIRVEEHRSVLVSLNETGHFDADRIAMRGAMNTASTLDP